MKYFKKEKPRKNSIQPTIIARSEHSISRSHINPHALKVLYRLHQAKYSAYLVGGCVRDLLLGATPKDFDIATNAKPEEVRKLFKNCRLIGKRFRLAHIVFGKEIIEVATFRKPHHEKAGEHEARMREGMIIRDNVYGSIEEDAFRRDFTINALYYNIADFSVVDYTNGMRDLAAHTLQIIGDPHARYQEDPVRLLRAARIAGKLNLTIAPETETPIYELNHLLKQVSAARLFQEVLKMFREGATFATFKLLKKYRLFEPLFPHTATLLSKPEVEKLLELAFKNTDLRHQQNKTLSPAFLLAVILWPAIMEQAASHALHPYAAYEAAIRDVLREQQKTLTIPKFLSQTIREICLMQHQFHHRHDKKPYRLLHHGRFRAAFDLLLLRAESGEPIQEIAAWWQEFYTHEDRREQMVHAQRRAILRKNNSTSF